MGNNSFIGHAKSGLGEGAYYMRIYSDKIESALGFVPFYGTLNLVANPLDVKNLINKKKDFLIQGFKQRGKFFGAVHSYKVRINDELDGALIIPVIAGHDENVVEIIAPDDLRKLFNIEDGNEVKVSER